MNTNNPNDNESAALRAANAELQRQLNVFEARYNALHARFGIQGGIALMPLLRAQRRLRDEGGAVSSSAFGPQNR